MSPLTRVCVLSINMCFLIIIPFILAGKDQNPMRIGELDDFLKERANKAVIEAMRSYEPDPEEVTKTFAIEVTQSLQGEKPSRKQLRDPSKEPLQPNKGPSNEPLQPNKEPSKEPLQPNKQPSIGT
ncbi:unnamed protein product [Lactuca virosa]|uniref:Pectate lyase N-terminal domain-containing protein n=1 Tax=Lactuca virosa TaxID=75947 RepID=A0AAU9MZ61_9ASTR|nr:unnamed protein product [Lactuca virosa]